MINNEHVPSHPIERIFIKFANTDDQCPHCQKAYSDDKDIVLNAVNKNKCQYTKVKCSCGKTFGATYDYTGHAVGFSLEQDLQIKFNKK